ncbi:MAG: gliding motility-associated C-terminal domain-containing protein [Roseivirga sp.]|uniref:T9SS type B sorting domain-containing protein n=1 Tax=Roseivirga sp. TaxID=1964215 RepID=UPI001B022698|nr:gliding motility-associated C-terminal domain-containing protein [Roseivirga sp.]MBO6496119.1 gliding motility-associated C-terminal domain-containing protein [Roseivirga sp.]
MSVKKLTLLLVAVLFQTFSLTAQNFTQHNWYYSGNDQALIFGKSPEATPILSPGKVPLTNIGEKLTATDPTTGDLLFYSDGVNIYDGTNQVMVNGAGITSDPTAIQGLSTSPVPGTGNEFLQYFFYRNAAGDILYTIVNTSAQGNRLEGPPAGEVSLGTKNIPTGITGRGDGMIAIGSRDLSEFWLLTQDEATGMFELYSIPQPGGTFDLVTNLNLTVDIDASHFSYHNATGQIAITPANSTNIQVIQFTEGGTGPELNFTRSILNSFNAAERFGGSTGWSYSGQFLYFSRNGAEGGLYRFDITDNRPEASIETVETYSGQESLSLQLAPDSTIYQITQEIGGGTMQVNSINYGDSAVAQLQFESGLFDGEDPESSYFSQFSPLKNLQPTITVGIQSGNLCQNTPIQFYPIIDPPTAIPSRVLWDFTSLGIESEAFAPVVTFDQAGPLMGSLEVEINGITYPGIISGNIEQNDLQLSLPDTTICPGETLELDAEPQSSGGGGGGAGGGTGGGGSYDYLWSTGETTQTIEVSESGDYWVVVTPTGGGCPVYGTGRVTVYGDENQTSNIWYFGNGAGLDFNEEEGLDPPPRSITEAHAMDAPAGTSTISDANGDVLFYTNGTSVWNRENGLMPNGNQIGGDSAAVQSVLIIPFVEDETMYYLFTTEQVYGENTFALKYSIVDMKADNGRGDVVMKDVVLYANNTERLASFEGGDGYWLVAHEYGNNTFRSYPITPDGIGTPILSSAGGVHSYNNASTAQSGMKFSSTGERIAVSIVEGNEDYVELFNFDTNTGEITEFEYRIDLNEGSAGTDEVYDVHFSPGGNKLFATMNNRSGGSPGGRILEYRVDSMSTETTRLASQTNIAAATTGLNFGQIQTGPNGVIYVAVETPGNPSGSAFVSSINVNEDTSATSGITAQAVALTVGNSRLGLPNIVQSNANPQQEPGMTAPDEVCVEQRVEMTGSGTSDIDVFVWSITSQDDNSTVFSAEGQDTAYVFPAEQSGMFNISLNISNRCGFDTTLVQPIEVHPIPDPPLIPQSIALCEGDTHILDALGEGNPDNPDLTFEWTDSQGNVVSTSRTYEVTQQEIYSVTISNPLGCSSSGETFVGPPFEIQLPESATICQDGSLTLDPEVNADNYIWTVTDSNNATTTLPNQRTADVDSSNPGDFLYVVSIEDPINPGCFVNDSTRVTINPLAQASAQNIINPACGATNGSFELNISSTGSYSYTVNGNSAGQVAQNSVTGPTTQLIDNLTADTYSVTITDNSSGCVNTVSDIQVQNDPPDFTITSTTPSDADCTNPTGSVIVSLSADVFPVDYVLTNNTDGTSYTGTVNTSIPATTFNFEVTGLSGGEYDLEVTSNGGCVQSSTGITIDQPQPVQNLQINGDTEVCAVNPSTNLTGTSDNGTAYTWVTPSGTTVNGATIIATESGDYTVTADAPGTACPTSEIVTVTLTVQPDVSFTVGDVCTGEARLEAVINNTQPNASYNYRWTNGSGDVIGTSRVITVTTTDNYTLTVREAGDLTCSGTYSEAIDIPEELEATITSSPACDDGSPVTLTVDVTSGNATSFTWVRGENTPVPQTGSTISVDEEGAYTVTISNGTCSIQRSINVRRQAIPEGLLPEVEYYCSTRTTNPTLLAGRGFETYEWTLDGQPYPAAGRTLDVAAPGVYVVTMTTAIGCVQTDTVTIIESCDPEVVAPNAFAPSSPAPNNTFSVFPNDFVDNFEIFIYTRWGELIYQSNTTEFKWDGTLNGELVPVGAYPYVIRFTSRFEPERGVFEQRGTVAVIR